MSKEQKARRQRPVREEPEQHEVKRMSSGRPMPTEYIKERPFWYYLIVMAIIVAIDQLLKLLVETHLEVGERVYVIDVLLDIVNVHNQGAAFNFLSDSPGTVLAISSGIIALGFIFLILEKGNPVMQMFVSLILGGAEGNFLDRVTRGYVVDYIDIHILPVFNFADICVTVGVLFLCIVLTAYSSGRARRAG